MPSQQLTEVVPNRIWTSTRAVWFSGVKLQSRSTVVRLSDGNLLLHSPPPPDEAMREALAALGPVRWVIVPNCFHHLGAPAAAACFKDATVVGPATAQRHNKALRIDIDIHDRSLAASLAEFTFFPLRGVPFLDETVVYHHATETLIGADLALCAEPSDHWTWRWAARLMGCYQTLRVPPDVKKHLRDKAVTAQSLQAMLAVPIQRLVVGHASIITDNVAAKLAAAWRREGVVVENTAAC